jgi:putative tryptophan/tyrosine transport system substrate-binding protein
MQRRDFIALLGGAAAWPVVAQAQQAGKVYRVGYLASGSQEPSLLEVLRQRLRELGWIEGRNIEFEYRFAEGK